MKLVEPEQSVQIKSKYALVWVTVILLVVVVVFMLLPRTISVKTDEGLALIKFDLDTVGKGV